MNGWTSNNLDTQNIPSIAFRMHHCLWFICSYDMFDKPVYYASAHNLVNTINTKIFYSIAIMRESAASRSKPLVLLLEKISSFSTRAPSLALALPSINSLKSLVFLWVGINFPFFDSAAKTLIYLIISLFEGIFNLFTRSSYWNNEPKFLD